MCTPDISILFYSVLEPLQPGVILHVYYKTLLPCSRVSHDVTHIPSCHHFHYYYTLNDTWSPKVASFRSHDWNPPIVTVSNVWWTEQPTGNQQLGWSIHQTSGWTHPVTPGGWMGAGNNMIPTGRLWALGMEPRTFQPGFKHPCRYTRLPPESVLSQPETVVHKRCRNVLSS